MALDLTGIEAIFLDDGGVMNDNSRRGPQYLQYLPEFFIPRLGGTVEAWQAANTEVATRQYEEWVSGARFPERGGFHDVSRAMAIEWIREQCTLVGVDGPEDDDSCARISREAHLYVAARLDCNYPGVVEAIRTLHRDGYRLYTASGTELSLLQAHLSSMGVAALFTQTYGPDLIDTHKGSRYYYEGILADSGESAATALFLDDSNNCVGWITEAGARGVLVTTEPPDETDAVAVIGSLAELPGLLAAGRQATE